MVLNCTLFSSIIKYGDSNPAHYDIEFPHWHSVTNKLDNETRCGRMVTDTLTFDNSTEVARYILDERGMYHDRPDTED
jgi:hypothetical protein